MRNKLGNEILGILFIAIGAIIALNAFELINVSLFFKGWWTLFIIIPAFVSIIKNGFRTSNVIFMIVGILLLLSNQNIISWNVVRNLIVPVIFVAIGCSILFKDKISDDIQKVKEISKDGMLEYSATFGEQKKSFDNEEFNGANVNAVFGGVNLDLRNAVINKDVVIDVSAIFGGIDIIVPNNVIVKHSCTPIFGGIDNKVISKEKDKVYTIYVNGVCMFGGVTIK